MNINVKIYFEIYSKANVLPESTNKAKYRRDCTEEKVLGWDVIVSASKVTSFKLQTFCVLLYCYVMDKSGKILLLHLLIRMSHKLLTLLKIFTGIYNILPKQVNDLQSTSQKNSQKFLSCSNQVADAETTSTLLKVLSKPYNLSV